MILGTTVVSILNSGFTQWHDVLPRFSSLWICVVLFKVIHCFLKLFGVKFGWDALCGMLCVCGFLCVFRCFIKCTFH